MKRVLLILCIILVITAIAGGLVIWRFSQRTTLPITTNQNPTITEQPTEPINSEPINSNLEISDFDTNDHLDEAFSDLDAIDQAVK